jgi:regulator of cell morphogenesis and NO signaling
LIFVAEGNIDKNMLVTKLNELDLNSSDASHNFKEWDLGFLADYIVNAHHKYVLKTLPELVFYTEKIASVHGLNHKELIEVANLFGQINTELLQHLKKEEEVLFPSIKEALKNNSTESKSIILSEISRMSLEHEFAGGTMDKINTITSNYRVPEDGCNTYHITFKLLQQFEDDLHIHVHLENNILYPKALSL